MNWITSQDKGFIEGKNKYINKDINLDLIISIDISKIDNEKYPIYTINFRTVNKENNRFWYFKKESTRNYVMKNINIHLKSTTIYEF